MPKRLTQQNSGSYPSVVLYRDDLDQLEKMLRDSCEQVTISDREFTFDSLSEMADIRGNSINALSLNGNNPYVHLEFNRSTSLNSIFLYAEETEQARRLFLEIQEKLRRQRRLLTYVFTLWFWLPLFNIAFFTFVLMDKTTSSRVPVAVVVIVLASLAGTVISVPLQTGFFFSLNLRRQHEARSWLKENIERLLMIFLGTLIGALGTSFFNWIAALLG